MTTIQVLAENDTFIVKGLLADWDTRSTKTRISANVSTEEMVAAIGEQPAYSTRGEDPENDAAWRAYNRAEVKTMKAQIMEANAQLNFLPADGFKLTFSKTAGCSCGCSPAFILAISTGRRLGNFARVWISAK